jgi:thiol-disulfide isomerase/thioredoxin
MDRARRRAYQAIRSMRPRVLLCLFVASALACGRAQAGEPSDAELLSRIAGALEDYHLPEFYRSSREFLHRFPDHAEADRVRYQFALQMVTENLQHPDTPDAREATALLEQLDKNGRTEDARFDAALVLMKFAPKEDRAHKADLMLERFRERKDLDQVYAFAIDEALARNDSARVAKLARAMVQRFPDHPDAPEYERVIRRAELIGTRFPLDKTLPRPLVKRFAGKVVLIDVFATWCAPCLAELPRLKAFFEQHKAQGFEILGVSVDQDLAAFERYQKESSPPWPLMHDRAKGGISERAGTVDLPTYVLLGKDGKVISADLRGDGLYRKIEELLSR